MWNLRLTTAILCAAAMVRGATLDLGTARLEIDTKGVVTEVRFDDGTTWPTSRNPVFAIESGREVFFPDSVDLASNGIQAKFSNGAEAKFSISTQRGFALIKLDALESPQPVDRLRLFHTLTPAGGHLSGTQNAVSRDGHRLAVQALQPNVYAAPDSIGTSVANRAGCTQEFSPTTSSMAGKFSAQVVACCDTVPSGWTMRRREMPTRIDLRGCTGIRAWVRGDGSGASLKIQLQDLKGGNRDCYIPIDFVGARHVTVTTSPLDTLDYSSVLALALYYNGLPAGRTVSCAIDQIEAFWQAADGTTTAVLLEDFEDPVSPWWQDLGTILRTDTLAAHGIRPAEFGIIACDDGTFASTMERFEQVAGLPSPHKDGVWLKRSPAIGKSYLFLTNFRESQFDAALALARRGGFEMVLLEQSSWCRATGHYEIDQTRFPGGVETLARTVRRFQDEGIGCGLHALAASIYPPDSYLTPVPDPRLVRPVSVALAADVDSKDDFLPLESSPVGFPSEDGGYGGKGCVLQCGNELITYASRKTEPPYGFAGCKRGHLGTTASAHRKGEPVHHLLRSYGYHMFDMDTTLLDEVTSHFAGVANACNVDMLYFDGSERLQGDHWYYNARLHKAIFDKLARKDVLLQASSYSHYSWHMLARSASADGHGDLKGYLDERSPTLADMAANGMPLDIGWYYGYDHEATLDQYEYVLAATIGYSSSMSYQVSVDAAASHPCTGAILDMIRRYEMLRLSGRVSREMRDRLKIDPSLGGEQKPGERDRKRREYRLLGEKGKERFQRVIYTPWREFDSVAREQSWEVNVAEGPAKVGFQVHVRRPQDKAATTATGAALVDPWIEVNGKRIAWQGKLAAGQYLVLWPGEKAVRYETPWKEPELPQEAAVTFEVPAGRHRVTFGSANPLSLPVRARLTLQPAECWPVEAKAR